MYNFLISKIYKYRINSKLLKQRFQSKNGIVDFFLSVPSLYEKYIVLLMITENFGRLLQHFNDGFKLHSTYGTSVIVRL